MNGSRAAAVIKMFEARRKHTQIRGAVSVLELIYFTTVRRIRDNHRNAVIALLLQMLTMMTMVLAFFVMFQLLGMRSSPVRGDYLIYLMSGIFMYLTHIKAVSAVMGAEGSTSPMMQHAPMNTAISICAAALSTLYMQTICVMMILLLYHVGFKPVVIDVPFAALGMLILAWAYGVAVGLVFMALKPWIPEVVNILKTVYIRINMIASGKMFLANALPATILPYFDWNPLFHIIDQARGFAFLHYNPHFTSVDYPIKATIAIIMIGLMGEHFTRQHASASWNAAR